MALSMWAFLSLTFGMKEQGYCQTGLMEWARIQDLESWESEDLRRAPEVFPSLPNPARLPKDCSLKLIRWYQKSIATRSIQRCPFFPSCSHFAAQAIAQHGFLIGVCLFIDRNLYRENPQIYSLYNFIEAEHGVLKLDDRYFLNRGK